MDPAHRGSLPDVEFLRNLNSTRNMSFSQNPRWRRHASLDAGVGRFRSRLSSTYEGEGDSPTSSSFGAEEEKQRLLSDFPGPSSPWSSPTRLSFERKRSPMKMVLVGVVLIFVGAVFGIVALSQDGAEDWWGVKTKLEDYGVKFKHGDCANPYSEYGRLVVDQKVPNNNRWVPYDPTCSPPELMAALRSTIVPSLKADQPLKLPLPLERPARNESLPLQWLHGKTVVLFGDHVERLHNKDFCRFAGGRFASIGAEHPLSPPRFVNGIDEKLPGANKTNFEGSRPSVCYIEQYDAMLISVFHYGLATRVEFERESLLNDQYFYPPVALDDRLSHIILPLLHSLNRQPDLIEFSSGFWDLRHMTQLDEQAGRDPFSDLNSDRLEWYSSRLHQAFNDLGSAFAGVPILWRALHQTPKFSNTPYARVAALDQLSRKVVRDLNLAKRYESYIGGGESHAGMPSAAARKLKGLKGVHAGRQGFLNQLKGRIGKSAEVEQVPVASEEANLKGMIRVDEWGSLMLGQQHLMNQVHTPPLPGGFLWGDIILFELRKAVSGTSPSRAFR